MFLAQYADDAIVVHDDAIMTFSSFKLWAELNDLEASDVRPATFEEIERYQQIQSQ